MLYKFDCETMEQDIEYICRLMVDVLKMPVYFLDRDHNIDFSLSYGYADNPLHSSQKELFSKLFDLDEAFDFPVVKSTAYHENYFAVKLNSGEDFMGTFIAGPSIYSYITAEAIDSLISENKLSLNYKRKLIHYYNAVTVVDYKRLVSASLLLYYCIYHKKLDLTEVMEKNSSLREFGAKIRHDFEENLSKSRQNIIFHHSQINEKNIFGCVKTGDKEKLLMYQQSPQDGEPGILSKNNPVRGQKNHAICAVTLATRAAIEGGLDTELAYTLSDLYIQEIEETNEIKDLADLHTKMLCDFTDRVNRVKVHQHSKAIKLCKRYILKHLYGDISLTELAKSVNLNANYLSELFKKEVGVSISEYIQNEKIEEAKRLLASSGYSILDIANWLHFHDQSHFTRVFKKLQGTTPKKYRDMNCLQ
ncbi:MAG: Transcriptional regulator, AraC [Clostridia bacterium]|nr:Transcriptional regulator, AraC [Clostridia bacterium]